MCLSAHCVGGLPNDSAPLPTDIGSTGGRRTYRTQPDVSVVGAAGELMFHCGRRPLSVVVSLRCSASHTSPGLLELAGAAGGRGFGHEGARERWHPSGSGVDGAGGRSEERRVG